MLVVMFRSVASRPIALWASTAISAVLLTGIIYFWTQPKRGTSGRGKPGNQRLTIKPKRGATRE